MPAWVSGRAIASVSSTAPSVARLGELAALGSSARRLADRAASSASMVFAAALWAGGRVTCAPPPGSAPARAYR